MIYDYRLAPWNNVLDIHNISGERHQIPTTSPFTVRLLEVPQKTEPTSLSVTCNGTAMTEVAATPEQGQFFPDYRASVTGDPNWNRGELMFNAADAGKWITVNYRGMGARPRGNRFTAESSGDTGASRLVPILCGKFCRS